LLAVGSQVEIDWSCNSFFILARILFFD